MSELGLQPPPCTSSTMVPGAICFVVAGSVAVQADPRFPNSPGALAFAAETTHGAPGGLAAFPTMAEGAAAHGLHDTDLMGLPAP